MMPGTIIQTVSPREARWLRVSLRSGHRVVGIVLAIFVLYSRRFAILIHLRGLTKQIGLALWVFALEVLPGDLTNCQSHW